MRPIDSSLTVPKVLCDVGSAPHFWLVPDIQNRSDARPGGFLVSDYELYGSNHALVDALMASRIGTLHKANGAGTYHLVLLSSAPDRVAHIAPTSYRFGGVMHQAKTGRFDTMAPCPRDIGAPKKALSSRTDILGL